MMRSSLFKYRPRGYIATLILIEGVHGTTLSRLNSHANINISTAKKYLRELFARGLVESHLKEGRIWFETTERGKKFIQLYREMTEIFPI